MGGCWLSTRGWVMHALSGLCMTPTPASERHQSRRGSSSFRRQYSRQPPLAAASQRRYRFGSSGDEAEVIERMTSGSPGSARRRYGGRHTASTSDLNELPVTVRRGNNGHQQQQKHQRRVAGWKKALLGGSMWVRFGLRFCTLMHL